MKVTARKRGTVDTDKQSNGQSGKKSGEQLLPWYDGLDSKEIVDLLPIMSKVKGSMERVQIPIHQSTVVIATQLRERYPQKFRINLDVYKSMLYAGRQLFDYVLMKGKSKIKDSRSYKLAMIMEELDTTLYDEIFVEELLKRLLEGYLSGGQGIYSREKILAKIELIKPLLPQELIDRCDIFVDEELDNESVKRRVEDRLRKRKYRESKKNLRVVK